MLARRVALDDEVVARRRQTLETECSGFISRCVDASRALPGRPRRHRDAYGRRAGTVENVAGYRDADCESDFERGVVAAGAQLSLLPDVAALLEGPLPVS